MHKFITAAAALSALATAVGSSAIVLPTIANDSNSQVDSGIGAATINMVNGNGLSGPLNNGDSLATAQALTHAYGGPFAPSFVSVGRAPEFFNGGPLSTIVLDLGADQPLSEVVLWQYSNDGGPGLDNQGNHSRTIDFQINTAAQGLASFAGPVSTITMLPVEDNDGIGGNDLGGVNSAQTFALTGTGRYVQLTITDNYRNFQGITLGGDRVGIGEIAFNAIPEPSASLLSGLGLVALLRRRR